MGLERHMEVYELIALGLNSNTAKRLYNLRQVKSVLKSKPENNYHSNKLSKGGYSLNKNGAPLDKSLLKSK